jgi:hypothetical protein
MDYDNILGFLCFVEFETNCTFLISSIVDESVMCRDSSDTQFMKDYKGHRIYAALIFAAQSKNETPCCESGYGSSTINHFKYSMDGTGIGQIG